MAVCESHLDTSGFYQTALDTLMDSLHISSTPNLEPTRCNNSFRRYFTAVDEEKFFSFCSTKKQYPKSDNVVKDKRRSSIQDNANNQQNSGNHNSNNIPTTPTTTTANRETPKRSLTTTRKQKLFAKEESAQDEFKPKTRSAISDRELSPQSLLLKKAITRFECLQRRQERIAMSKKPMRTSLRV